MKSAKMLMSMMLLMGIGYGQPPTEINMSALPPAASTQVTAQTVGTPGLARYFYWVIVTYPIGNALPIGPIVITNAPDTITASNYVRISWNTVPGATSYSVIRNTTNVLPASGSNNAVVNNTTATSVNNDNTPLVTYTATAPIPTAYGSLIMNNKDYAVPRIQIGPGINPATLGLPSGSSLPATCLVGDTFFVTTATAGENTYGCTSPNVWTLQSGGGGGSVASVSAGPTGALTVDNTDPVNPIVDIDTAYVPSKTAGNDWLGNNNFLGAAATFPAKGGISLPATCLVGEQFFDTDAPPGSNLFGCTATNVWSSLGGGNYPPNTVPPTYLWQNLCRVSATGWYNGFQNQNGGFDHSTVINDPMCSTQYSVSGTDAGLIYSGDGGDKRVRIDGDWDFTFDVRHPNDTTKNLFMGVLQGTTVTNDGCWIRGSFVSVATTYKLYCRQGGVDGTETDMVTTMNTNRNRFRIRRVGGIVYASINGGTEYTTTTQLPTTTSLGGPAIRWNSTSGGSATMYFYRFGMNY
jgi:hypothetical protein